MFLGIMSPDQQWLEFAHGMSDGPLSHSGKTVFDPGRKFFTDYDARRKGVEEHVKRTARFALPTWKSRSSHSGRPKRRHRADISIAETGLEPVRAIKPTDFKS